MQAPAKGPDAVRDRRPAPSLWFYIAMLAAALTLPLLVLAGIVTWRYAEAEAGRLEAAAAQRNEDLASEVDRILASRLAILQVLASSPALDGAGDIARFDEQARQFSREGIDIRLRELSGQLLVDTGQPPGTALPHWPLLDAMNQAVQGRLPVFVDLYVSRGTGTYAVALVLPIVRDGEVRYLVSTIFHAEFFAQLLAGRGIRQPYFASIVDRSGLIIARSERHAELVGKPLPGFAESRDPAGRWRGINSQGVTVSGYYRRSPLSGWMVTAGVDVAALRAPLNVSLAWLAATATGLGVLAVGLSGLIMRRVGRAVVSVTEAASAMGRGQLTVVPETGIAEANAVGQAISEASIRLHRQAAQLVSANSALEDRVEERTRELAASEERYRLLADHASDMIVLRNIEGRVFYASPASLKLIGYSPEDMLDVTPSMLVHPDDMERVRAISEAIGAGRESDFSIHRLRHRDGHWVWVQAAFSRLSGRGADEPNIMAVVRDDTERQQSEARLRQSNEALKQFSAIVSHDLQAPLRHINMFAEMLKTRAEAADPQTAETAGRIMASAERMQRLIRSLNAYTQVAYREVRQEPVPLARVVAEALQLLDADIREAAAEVKVFNLPMVLGDPDLLVRLFQNLIANAVKYRGEASPVIRIRSRPAGRFWEIRVEDNGIGIATQHGEKVFEIFRRLHRDESRYAGMGVGLALCRRVVESHGGEIWLDTEASQGACFRFTLPRRREPAAPPEAGEDHGAIQQAHADR
ncbi:sensor histidine kinase [Phreatobacter sp.]|uniref:sensor histidine kinase n=1 Tax=Phreatobacter sp. TaxID=1966341 RepID=UPI003F6F6A2E